MTANTGRTHPKYLTTMIDNSSGTLTDLSAYVDSNGTFGLKFEEQDVTGMSDAIKNIVIGRPEAPLKIVFKFDTAVIAHLSPLAGRNTPLSLDFRVGVGHTWEAGEPCFGISSSATSGYVLSEFTTDGEKVNTSWNVVGAVAPDFAVAAHT